MPRPASSVPTYIPALHLYRHLLREASYLPPAFSGTISDQIRHRFHQHAQHAAHVKKRLARGRSTLRTLKAANHGDTRCMESLISKGFGRSGKRRRELVSQFVAPQGPSDSTALEALLDTPANGKDMAQEGKSPGNANDNPGDVTQSSQHGSTTTTKTRAKHAFLDKWDKEKLAQLLSSQRHQQQNSHNGVHWYGRSVKKLDDKAAVPKTNSWGKPPAEALARTKRAGWWKRQADKIMPPLGRGEWDLLQRLSHGGQEEGEWKLPPRRTPAQPVSEVTQPAEASWDWGLYATNSTAAIERPRDVKSQRCFGEIHASPYIGKQHRQTLSDRWFRRTYRKMWRITPHMEQDPNTLNYKFAWGTAGEMLPPPTERQLGLFEGVDARGKPLDQTSKPQIKP